MESEIAVIQKRELLKAASIQGVGFIVLIDSDRNIERVFGAPNLLIAVFRNSRS